MLERGWKSTHSLQRLHVLRDVFTSAFSEFSQQPPVVLCDPLTPHRAFSLSLLPNFLTSSQIRNKILGYAGTYVKLHFRRPGGQMGTGPKQEHYLFEADLMRGNAEFIER